MERNTMLDRIAEAQEFVAETPVRTMRERVRRERVFKNLEEVATALSGTSVGHGVGSGSRTDSAASSGGSGDATGGPQEVEPEPEPEPAVEPEPEVQPAPGATMIDEAAYGRLGNLEAVRANVEAGFLNPIDALRWERETRNRPSYVSYLEGERDRELAVGESGDGA